MFSLHGFWRRSTTIFQGISRSTCGFSGQNEFLPTQDRLDCDRSPAYSEPSGMPSINGSRPPDVGHRVTPYIPGTWTDERLIDEIVESVVDLQEGLDSLPQLGIAQTFAIQDCGAFREVIVACSLQENCLHAHGSRGMESHSGQVPPFGSNLPCAVCSRGC